MEIKDFLQKIKHFFVKKKPEPVHLSELFINHNGILCREIINPFSGHAMATAIDVGPVQVGEMLVQTPDGFFEKPYIVFAPTLISKMMSKKQAWEQLAKMNLVHTKVSYETFDREQMIRSIWKYYIE